MYSFDWLEYSGSHRVPTADKPTYQTASQPSNHEGNPLLSSTRIDPSLPGDYQKIGLYNSSDWHFERLQVIQDPRILEGVETD